jgi:hypothetical protein
MVRQDLDANGAAKAVGAAGKRYDEPHLGRMASETSASDLGGRVAVQR